MMQKTEGCGLFLNDSTSFVFDNRLAGGVVVFLSGIFSLWSVLNGESFYGYFAIFLAYIATTNLYQYNKSHEKMHLYVGVLAVILSVLNTRSEERRGGKQCIYPWWPYQ